MPKRITKFAIVVVLLAWVSQGKSRAEDAPDGVAAIVQVLGQIDDADLQVDLLKGMHQSLAGRRKVQMPTGWRGVYVRLARSPREEVRDLALHLALIFGDQEAIGSLRRTMMDRSATGNDRTRAIDALVQNQIPDLARLLHDLVTDKAVRASAIRGLAAYDHEKTPAIILACYDLLSDNERQDAIQTLASRPAYALALLDALKSGKIPLSDVSAFTARQLAELADDRVAKQLKKVWGDVRESSEQRQQQIAALREQLTTDVLAAADRTRGRELYEKNCMSCHKLYGQGGEIGPDITGSNRDNLDYLLQNIIDPSAAVAREYRVTIVVTDRGRVISGIIIAESTRTLTVQTINERLILDKSAIEEQRHSPVSMMPDGLADKLSKAEFRDLIAYLADKSPQP